MFQAPPSSHPGDPVLGNTSLLQEILDNEVKGLSVTTRHKVVTAMSGADAVARVSAALPADIRRAWDVPPLATAWIPMAQFAEMDRAIIHTLFGGDVTRMREVARRGALLELNAFYKFLLTLGTPSFVLKRLGVAFSAKVRKGTLMVEDTQDRKVTMALTDAVVPLYLCQHTMPGWATMALEQTGGRNVTIQKLDCRHRGAVVCRWACTWN